MSFLKWFYTLLHKIYFKTVRTIVLAGYDHRTIYKYFRKQGAQIGEGCSINIKSLGSEPYLISIGNNVWISSDVVFHNHDGGVWVLRDQHPYINVYGPIIIEDNCIIGRNVNLLPNIRIGKNSIVGANSVVISDVPPYSIVMGVPARPIGSYAKYEERSAARWKDQSPPGVDTTVKNWWLSAENMRKLREHLKEMYMNPEKRQEKNSDK
jgi:acetyltransferase-like isoleucine patch superfamily enzyme